jgi:hypothetical protein
MKHPSRETWAAIVIAAGVLMLTAAYLFLDMP